MLLLESRRSEHVTKIMRLFSRPVMILLYRARIAQTSHALSQGRCCSFYLSGRSKTGQNQQQLKLQRNAHAAPATSSTSGDKRSHTEETPKSYMFVAGTETEFVLEPDLEALREFSIMFNGFPFDRSVSFRKPAFLCRKGEGALAHFLCL